MTCYKLVTCEFKWFGLQSRVESLIQKSERRLFTSFHRQVFCTMDKWHGLTMADIRAIEDKTKHELDKVLNQLIYLLKKNLITHYWPNFFKSFFFSSNGTRAKSEGWQQKITEKSRYKKKKTGISPLMMTKRSLPSLPPLRSTLKKPPSTLLSFCLSYLLKKFSSLFFYLLKKFFQKFK